MNEIRFFVAGKPQPAGSKRAFPFKRKDGKLGVAVSDDNPRAVDWKAVIAHQALHHAGWQELLTGPIELRLIFHVARPAGHFGSGKNSGIVKASAPPRPTTKPDVLKLARGVEDALTNVLWRDDAQIVDEHLHKVYSATPGVEIIVKELPTAAGPGA